MDDLDEQIDGSLAVREEAGAFLVVRAEDPDDWLARFEKTPDFPAREWAENMARVYNRRLGRGVAGPPTPPGTRPASYHPRDR
ncbi:MAG TPA: hypothetical protein VK869_08080 [Rubrobacteraceae bacterium]|nr:hypothetical protein [Rubrobacteraceae bacterium]